MNIKQAVVQQGAMATARSGDAVSPTVLERWLTLKRASSTGPRRWKRATTSWASLFADGAPGSSASKRSSSCAGSDAGLRGCAGGPRFLPLAARAVMSLATCTVACDLPTEAPQSLIRLMRTALHSMGSKF